MAVEGDVWQGFVSSLVSNTEEAKQGEVCEDVLSPEDAAWVDSCLVNDAELTEDSWDAIKDALIDIVSLQTTSQNAPVSESDPMNEEYEDLATAEFLGGTEDDHVPSNEKAKIEELLGITDEDDMVSIIKKIEAAPFRDNLRKGFFSSYRDPEDTNVAVDVDSEDEIESSSKNIFKVWDLNTLTEEDELVQELRKALAGSCVEDATVSLDDSRNGNGEETLDGLVSGLADLSLRKSSS
ncbi:hypothetical protein MKW94_019382 [Papaver nudicaule]|uniref:Uncharacterized protein n=1 Tax=Papaver nudicaule TaxID=74823 RepID=A0AA42B2U4_PAPNU|nr:hypothetical protein [Papaver nudicaule]MCL7048346.1 hypothetical protein [Papaver nudicaule]